MEKERIYTLYAHTNIFNGKKYIGITKQKPRKRWANGKGYRGTTRFYCAIKKYGWNGFRHEIILCNLTHEEAEMFEILMIKYYKTTNKRYGYNMENGGNLGKKLSKETKEKIGKSRIYLKGKEHPNYGKPLPEETKTKLSKSHKGLQAGEKHPLYGTHQSEKSKNKNMMSQPNRKEVICLETKEIFYSISECSRKMNIDSTMISLVCRGKQAYAKGFHFQYYNDFLEMNK